jgi:NAD(P)-dependent dehydrogenase (short-subunit alcohol dehydrogenase family)
MSPPSFENKGLERVLFSARCCHEAVQTCSGWGLAKPVGVTWATLVLPVCDSRFGDFFNTGAMTETLLNAVARELFAPAAEPGAPRIALVTGAGTGIGKACALALLEDGWTVVFAGRRLPVLEEAIAASPHAQRARAVVTDVANPDSVAALFGCIQTEFGRLDLLFNNAGVFTAGVPLDELPVAAWQQAVNINLNGAFYCLREAFGLMKRQVPRGGRIINNGSISAQAPRPNSIAYTATKHAMTGMTKAAALDGRHFDIAVGQIDIGNAATDMTTAMAQGMLQADGSVRAEARMDVCHVADAVVAMARLPLNANVLNMTVLATAMPFVGRG